MLYLFLGGVRQKLPFLFHLFVEPLNLSDGVLDKVFAWVFGSGAEVEGERAHRLPQEGIAVPVLGTLQHGQSLFGLALVVKDAGSGASPHRLAAHIRVVYGRTRDGKHRVG